MIAYEQVKPHIRTRDNGRGGHVEYVPWFAVVKLLSELDPEWTSTIVRTEVREWNSRSTDAKTGEIHENQQDWCEVEVALTIKGVTRHGIGQVGLTSQAPPIEVAETSAVTRAARWWGIHAYEQADDTHDSYPRNGGDAKAKPGPAQSANGSTGAPAKAAPAKPKPAPRPDASEGEYTLEAMLSELGDLNSFQAVNDFVSNADVKAAMKLFAPVDRQQVLNAQRQARQGLEE